MSTYGTTTIDPRLLQSQSAPEDPTAGGEFSKGISRGLRNTGSGFMEAGALGAEALGLPTVQQRLRTGAKSLRDEAAGPEFAAEAPTFDDVHGVGQGLRWGIGKAGEMAPLLAGAVAGGVIAKNPFIGGTAALAPASVGDIAQRQYEDPTVAAQPVGERGLRALGGGIADSALTNIPFGGIMGRGVGAGASKTLAGALAKNVGEGVVTGGVGMGSGEAVKQLATNPDAAFNTDQIGEAALGGAVTMGAMHVPVAGVSYMRGNGQAIGEGLSSARKSINEKVANARSAALEKVDDVASSPTGQKLSSFSDDLGDSISQMVSKSREKYEDVAEKIRSGELLGTTKEAIAGMTPERVKEAMDFSDNETVKTVTKWGNDMLNKAGLDDAKRAEITEALSKAGERSGQVALAGLKKASDLGDAAKQHIDKFVNDFKDSYNETGSTKKSDDTSGARQVILNVLDESGLKEKRPELFSSSADINRMADALRVMVEGMSRGPLSSDKLSAATKVFGETTASVMSAIRKTLGDVDTAKTESFFKNLNQISNIEKSGKGLHDTMMSSLTDEAKANGAQHSIGEHADVLMKHARGFDLGSGQKPTEQHKFFNSQVQDYYERTFGPKADAVRKAVEKEAKMRKGMDEQVKVDEDGNPLEAEATETMKFGLTKPDSRGNSKSVLGGTAMLETSRYAKQHLLDLKAKYPEHDVRFERMPDSDMGHIVVEKRADPGKFNDAELAGMAHDTKKYPNSPSKLKVGDMSVDAVKVASAMSKKGQADFDGPGNETSAMKTANAFKAGIAQLTEQFGQVIDVPDSAVIGTVGGKPLTWGAAKKLKGDTAENRMSKDGQAKLATMREEYKSASIKRKGELRDEVRKLTDFEKARELSGDQDTRTSSQANSARSQRKAQRFGYESKPHDNSDGRFDAEGNLTKEGARILLEGDAHGGIDVAAPSKSLHELDRVGTDSGQGRSDVSADENPHLVNAVHGKEMKRAANMDGTPHFVGDKIARGSVEGLDNLANELKARTSKLQQALGDKIKVLIKPETRIRISDNDMTSLREVIASKPSAIAAVVNRLTEKYGMPEAEIAKSKATLESAISKRQDYLDNPPEDYSIEKSKGIIDWATTQKERVDEAYVKAVKEGVDADRQDQLSDMKSALTRLVKKAKSVIEGDESLADKEGSIPNPKAVAAKKAAFLERAASGDKALLKELSESTDAKGLQRAAEALPPGEALDVVNTRLSELVQDEAVAYGLQTKKYSLESTNDSPSSQSRLISRLANDRSSRFANDTRQGVFRSGRGTDTFGPLKDGFTYYHTFDSSHTYTAVVPTEFVARLEKYLQTARPEKEADALAFFAAQHLVYDISTGKVQTFVPAEKSPAYKFLDDMGALEKAKTTHAMSDGSSIMRIRGVSDAETAKFLGTALAYSKNLLGEEKIFADWKRITGANEGKEGSGWFSAEKTDPQRNNAQDPGLRAAIKDHIANVLGNSVRTAWASFTHAGEYSHAQGQGLIRLSVHALDPMSTAYHESLHAFFAQLRDGGAHDITSVLEKAASSEHVLAQLKERYKNEPGVLKQLADPEERAAYMYQTWAVDPSFKVSIAAKTVFGKIADMIRNALGLWSNDQRALHIMDYFHSGEYAKNMSSISGVRHALMDSHRSQILDSAKAVAEPLGRLADAVVGSGSARLRDTGIPALNTLADAIKREGTVEGGDQGYIPASGLERRKRLNALGAKLAPYAPEQLNDALESLQRATRAASPEARLAVHAIKGVLAETKAYMEAAGVKMGDLGPDYFPRVWDTHYISKNQQAFRDMLEPYIRSGQMTGTADQLIKNLITRGGSEFGIETREPGMQFKKERLLTFISHADAAQFMSKDLYGTLSSYVTQATRKAEWTRRLGGGKLESLMTEAKGQGATPEQIKTAELYMKGVDGTLGDDLNPHARRIMGNMIVYQNIRLLPLAAFSMVIDPNGIMVRGGTVSDAWKTFKRGISEVPQSYGRAAKSDRASELAELVGVIDSAVLSHTMGDLYTQGMVGGTAEKLNNAFFKYNMVEGLNRSFRVGASEAAMSFMARHSDLKNSVHSRRWMAELGIQKGDIIKTPDGRIALTEAEGLTKAQVQRVHAAVNQWVDGAVLRPDAADKPIWMNDPRFALISHLKQFVFSFQKTILERVAHEYRHGNYTPAMALASYVPMMMAADLAKGMLTNSGDSPDWQAGWDITDYVAHGMQRAGLFGVAQFGLDVAKDIKHGNTGAFALLGPTVEQARDGVEMLGGRKQFGPTVLRSLPANALYAHQFGKSESAPGLREE